MSTLESDYLRQQVAGRLIACMILANLVLGFAVLALVAWRTPRPVPDWVYQQPYSQTYGNQTYGTNAHRFVVPLIPVE